MILLSLAFLWGLAEASVFFIVPDVIISVIAIQYGFKQGLFAVCAAVIGAMLGGALLYAWGRSDIASARAFFDLLPAIAPTTIARAGNDIAQPLFGLSVLKGSVTGVPFKLYAAEAGAAAVPLWKFVALTPLVRLPRFLLAASLSASLSAGLSAWVGKAAGPVSPRAKMMILIGLWVVFYAIYWLNADW